MVPNAYASLIMEGDILWDRIVSIEYAGEEHVYDIEVEGTHNFIAGHVIARRPKADEAISYFFGGIIAHNTYMSGNVGIGTAGPGSLLTVAGGDISIDSTKKLNLEGSAGDTYIVRSAAGAMSLFVDGNEIAVFRKQTETR